MNNRYSSLSRAFFVFCVALLPYFSGAQTVLDSLPPIDSLSDRQINDLTQEIAVQARGFEQVLSAKSISATQNRTTAEELWKTAKADSTIAKTVTDSLSGLLKAARNEEKTALRQQGQAAKTVELATKTLAADSITQRKNLRKLWKETRQLNEMVNPAPVVPKVAETPDATEPKKKEKKKKPAPENPVTDSSTATPDSSATPPAPRVVRTPPPATTPTKKYDPAGDVMLNPPALPCTMAVKTRDEFSGEIYRRTTAAELFRSSPPALKNFLQGKVNVQCEASLAAIGASSQLYLTFTINDPAPRKAFGRLEKGSIATLTFMDGTSYTLYNQQTEEGVTNIVTQAFVIRGQYPIPADALKKIRRSELDKIRIAWSSGYEDYDVQYIQLLMGQAKCLFE